MSIPNIVYRKFSANNILVFFCKTAKKGQFPKKLPLFYSPKVSSKSFLFSSILGSSTDMPRMVAYWNVPSAGIYCVFISTELSMGIMDSA